LSAMAATYRLTWTNAVNPVMAVRLTATVASGF
jgi:hypothetical protein